MDRVTDKDAPMLAIFRAKRADLPEMWERATRLGAYTGAWDVHTQQQQPMLKRVPLKREDASLWIAMGRDKSFVRRIVDSCQQPSEGAAVQGPRMFPLILAGIVSGWVVILMLMMFTWILMQTHPLWPHTVL